MPEGRPSIPAQIKRDVLIESGYRCAIPRCGQTEITIDHIDDYAKVKEHSFDNHIVLCANCHQRKTQGRIDRKALLQTDQGQSFDRQWALWRYGASRAADAR